jgi:ubiquinone/menaquinone biosynthesis C-methylase UbiE
LKQDVASAPSSFTSLKNTTQWWGVDYVFSALEQVHQHNPNLILAQTDVHALPFPESSFGAYLSYGVVDHFPQGPQQAILKTLRVLKPGGLIL